MNTHFPFPFSIRFRFTLTARLRQNALVLLLMIGAFAIFTVASGNAPALADGWAVGDVVVARSFENLQTYYEGTHSIFDNNGNYREGVQGPGTTGADCAFAASGDLYAAQYFDPAIAVFSSSPPHNIIQTIDTRVNAQNNTPGSIVFAANGDFLVALYQADGFRGVARYNPEGVRQDLYDFGAIGIAGIAGMDLAADQRTLFYTAYDSGQILRYDLVTRQQLDPFAQVGDTLGEIKLLPPGDGSNGLVVSHRVSQPASGDVKGLNGSGNIVQTYDVAGEEEWDGVDLDPNGTSVWANSTTSAYRFNIATAALERGPFGPTTSYPISKLCVRSEAITQPTSTPTPTATPTASPTNTPNATPTPPACEQYQFATSTGTIVPAVTDIGSHCDDCTVAITLPFPYALYGTLFTSANISSNGNIQFQSTNASYANVCLATTTLNYAILPYWDDLSTVGPGPSSGVFTSVSGTAPNRIFNIEWRATLVAGGTSINFEARLYEGQTRFDVIYGAGTNVGNSATVGVQRDTGSRSTQYACNSAGPAPGVMLTFTLPACPTATPTSTPACVAPTPFPYPWCPSAPTATASPTAPRRVSSYYVQPTYTPPPGSTPTPQGTHGYWWNQGYNVANSMITSGGPQFGLAILGFGKPDVIYEGLDATWRVRVLGRWDPAIYLSIEEVQLLAGEFASGFYSRASSADAPPYIVVAIGTTNYWSPSRPLTTDEFYLHGYNWGDAVKKLNGKYQTYFPIVKFEGAYDVEFAWSPPEYALRWTQGFELATRAQCPLCREYYYYTYASCDDCYYPGSGGDPDDTILENYHEEGPLMTWSLDQAVGVTVANRAALVLPQIYYPAGSIPTDQAGQWGWLASYAATHYLCLDEYRIPRGIPGKPAFQGSMVDGTGAPALPAELAWQRLWMALDRQSCTSPNPSDMEYVTTIRYLPKP